jgi:hypothetical protein
MKPQTLEQELSLLHLDLAAVGCGASQRVLNHSGLDLA